MFVGFSSSLSLSLSLSPVSSIIKKSLEHDTKTVVVSHTKKLSAPNLQMERRANCSHLVLTLPPLLANFKAAAI
jgi:hypothetical protein